jgi:hypothetical protein
VKGRNPPRFPSSGVEEGKPLGFNVQTDRKEKETLKRAGLEDGREGRERVLIKKVVSHAESDRLESIPAGWHWLPRQTFLAKGSRRLDHCGANIHLDTL